jgi:hypothetical protein
MEDRKQVLHTVVRLASKQPLTLLRLLLVGDVHYDADEVERLAILVVQALATRFDPTDRSVLLKQPEFMDEFLCGGERIVHSRSYPLHVLGMDACEIFR